MFKNKNTKVKILFVALLLFFGVFLFFGQSVLAQDTLGINRVGNNLNLPTTDIRLIIAQIIRAVLGLLGIVALGIVLYGGYVYMTAAGNEEKVNEAKKILINGVIGLAIILSAFAIAQFIINSLSSATGFRGNNTNENSCDKLEYALDPAHKAECEKTFCTQFPGLCSCEDQHFVVKSITPQTTDTKMNNPVVRVVFSRKIADMDNTELKKYLTILINNVTSTNDFAFSILGKDQEDANSLIEAHYKDSTLPKGVYKVIVSPNIKDINGNSLELKTTCGDFKADAEFTITTGGSGSYSNGALKFDLDHSHYVSIPDSDSLDLSNQITISAWVNRDTFNGFGYYQWVAGKVNAFQGLAIGSTNGQLYFFTNGGAVPNLGTTKPLTWELNKWYHVAAVYQDNGTTKVVKFYRDGVELPLDTTNPAPTVGVSVNNNPFVIGLYPNGGNNVHRFSGLLDEVRVYGRTLSANEVKTLYDGGRDNTINLLTGGLVGAWNFDEVSSNTIVDYSGNNNNGTLVNSPERIVTNVITTSGDVKDETKPVLTPVVISQVSKSGTKLVVSDSRLPVDNTYFFDTTLSDNSGAGYLNLLLNKGDFRLLGDKTLGYYSGPQATSDAPTTNPYIFSYRQYFPEIKNLPQRLALTMNGFDIDSNSSTVNATIVLIGKNCKNGIKDGDETGVDVGGSCGGGDGASCRDDLDCAYSYKCIDPVGKGNVDDQVCRPFPLIEDVQPMDGGAGNWVTILGRNFGTEKGQVSFGIDKNGDGVVQEGDWLNVNLADCGSNTSVWHDQWVIVEVPNDTDLNQNLLSDVKLQVNKPLTIAGKSTQPSDDSAGILVNNWGPLPGTRQGWFLKNNIKRPGLCSVLTLDGKEQAPPKTQVLVTGKGLGENQGDSMLKFGGAQSSIGGWSDKVINAFVPILGTGKVGVVATVGGENSNGVPFEVTDNPSDTKPIIDYIDPASSTPKSYITIVGKNFGEDMGQVYLSTSPGGASCGANCNLITSLPDFCGDTWHDDQVIVQLPDGFFDKDSTASSTNYYLILKRNDRVSTDGHNDFTVRDDKPAPGICLLEPRQGPAPLGQGQFLKIYGVNFSNDPTAYFWSKNSDTTDRTSIVGWLSNNKTLGGGTFGYSEFGSGERVTTTIPYDQTNGYTMETGPIKIMNKDGELSNGVNYLVTDCTKSSATIPGFQCCTEGPETGKWKSSAVACKGQADDAGYVWRFTTGLIPKLPEVMEICDQANWGNSTVTVPFPSPSPWINWEGGNNACLNARIAVRFNLPMKDDFTGKVEVYKCKEANDGSINCTGATKVTGLNMSYGSRVLYVSDGKTDLQANTWYHVVLKDGIVSAEQKEQLGEQIEFNQPLKKSRPCGNGTAYCFDFKTGEGKCTLASAGINPDNVIYQLLGVLQDPGHLTDWVNPFNPHPPAQPYYYYVWGLGNRKCTVLNVDGYGWNWQSDHGVAPTKWATVEKASGVGFIDSRAKVTAWSNTTPYDLKITASTNTLQSVNDTALTTITGTSTLKIDLADPKVISYWPNCEEACINAEIGVEFNQMMDTSTFASGVKLFKCNDESCVEADQTDKTSLLKINSEMSGYNILRTYVSSPYLDANTWYVIKLSGDIKAIGAFKDDGSIVQGKSLTPFVWKFRTKNDNTPCLAETIEVIPKDFTAVLIGEKTKYSSLPKTKPDSCSPYGQNLNPWGFGWGWSVSNTAVANISNFSTGDSLSPFCDMYCKPVGSNKKLSQVSTYCGDGIVGPGEDCDIATNTPSGVAEVAGKSCGYDCLRPGNTNSTTTVSDTNEHACGDGYVSDSDGEQCDPGIAEQKAYCNTNCTWKGSSQTRSTTDIHAPWCGSGSVTTGETCDINDPATKEGCSSNCLHVGTPLLRYWCDQPAQQAHPPVECKNAISICGNGYVESGEECEVVGANKIKIHNVGGEIQITQATSTVCSSNCLLQNLCPEDKIPVPLRCDKDEQGCRPDCTLWGSSPDYNTPSLCGDGRSGTGEYPWCEISLSNKILGQNPVQVATAVGLGQVDEKTGKQSTNIIASTTAYADKNGAKKSLTDDQKKMGTGNYYVQCGYTEFATSSLGGSYVGNDCPLANDANLQNPNSIGAGTNSCCYPRLARNTEYPADGAGFASDAVCRNTYIEVTFSGEINDQTLLDNIVLLAGHEDAAYNCAASNTIDRTDLVQGLLTYNQPKGFWQNLWEGIKHFFAQLFNNEKALATIVSPQSKVWCDGEVGVKAEAHYQRVTENNVTRVSTTTVAIYINNLLSSGSEYALLLKGGLQGIRDVNGVGIRGKESTTKLDDVWMFKTGDKICKIKEILVKPNKAWFKKANSSLEFVSRVKSQEGQVIVPIQNVYYWQWYWAPQKSNIFAIPASGNAVDAASDTVQIASKTVEGSITGVAQAKVTADLTTTDNQLGKIFTGTTELIAKFCENPWPAPTGENEWQPLKDNDYNFSFSYCADAGKSGITSDDLPFMSSTTVERNIPASVTVPGVCEHNPSQSCTDYSQCPTYVAPVSGICDHNAISCLADSECPSYTNSTPGLCTLSSGSCNSNSDCPAPAYYVMPYINPVGSPGWISPACDPATVSYTQLLANNCKVFNFPTDKFCENPSFMYQSYKNHNNNYVACSVDSDCYTNLGESCVSIDRSSNGSVWFVKNGAPTTNSCTGMSTQNIAGRCVGGGTTENLNDQCIGPHEEDQTVDNPALQDDILRRYLLFSDVNDDVIGVQIFQNPKRLSAKDWLAEKFPNSTGVQTIKVAGYDALQDGDNYYINALNLTTTTNNDYALYNNIYQISLNKSPQSNTKKVLEQILDSLEFNTNISDHKYCLREGATLQSSPDNINDQFSCSTDFECRDANGSSKAGASGVCSDAKTKFFRDLTRLDNIATMESKLDTYFNANLGKVTFEGDLLGGTFIPGFTVSLWPSWNNTLGTKPGINGLPQDPVNAWTSCTDNGTGAEKQTCWDTTNSRVYCPNFSSVYEYEYVTSTKSYLLHAPLEFFNYNNNIVAEKVDLTKVTTTPWCQSQTFSPFGGKCGDGIVGLGEDCDPPGRSQLISCGVDSYINETCDNSCHWQSGVCTSSGVCGDGFVDANEACDSGAKNGVYGECAGPESRYPSDLPATDPNYAKRGQLINACQDRHPQYCGNGKIDVLNGHNLEVCEKVPEQQVVDRMGALGLRVVCNHYLQTTTNTQWLALILGCGLFNGHCTEDPRILCASDMQCQNVPNDSVRLEVNENTTVSDYNNAMQLANQSAGVCTTTINYGPNYTYNRNKSLSCSFDCQKLGSYCGDGVVDSQYGEQCDDGNSVDTDACRNNCITNVAPITPTPTSTTGCGNGIKEEGETCDLGSGTDGNGHECSPEYGKYCLWCAADCSKEYRVDSPNYCGNGKVDVINFKNGLANLEACDVNNGQVVTGTYSFGSLFTGVIQGNAACSDKGTYSCNNDCTALVSNCVSCNKKLRALGGTGPYLSIINPLLPKETGTGWNHFYNYNFEGEYVDLIRTSTYSWISFRKFINSDGHFVDPLSYQYLIIDAQNNSTSSIGIETNPECNGEYGLFFNRNFINQSKSITSGNYSSNIRQLILDGRGDVFPYQVNGEVGDVKNDVVMSPAVPVGTVRIVLKWTAGESKYGGFEGNIYNRDFGSDMGSKTVNYLWAVVSSTQANGSISYLDYLCGAMDPFNQNNDILWPTDMYWLPASVCHKYYHFINVHPEIDNGNTFVQSFTLDMSQATSAKPYAFFVQGLGSFVGGSVKNSKLEVDVYEYHSGQVPAYSIYLPTKVFQISDAAGTSSNPLAKYWHVFNIKKTTSGYTIEPIQTIETDSQSLLENLP